MLISVWSSGVCSSDLILAFCNLLVVAGNETTRNAISGGMVVLEEHPEERAKLQFDMPKYIASAVEEILRWTSPLHPMRSEERRAGNECFSWCRTLWSPNPQKQN